MQDKSLERPPGQDASDFELWDWVKTHQDRLHVIPFDVKLWSRLMAQKGYYSWTIGRLDGKEDNDYDILLIMVEGVRDYVAVLPHAVWRQTTDSAHGIERMSGRVPSWMVPYMVHFDHIGAAFNILAQAAMGEHVHFVNPTSNHVIRGWTPKASTGPAPIEPKGVAEGVDISYKAILHLFSEIKQAGCKVYFNVVQPSVHDFYIDIPSIGKVRVEHKSTDRPAGRAAFQSTDERRSALDQRRMWHLFYGQCADGVICFARHELPAALAGTDGTKLNQVFAHKHTYTGFSEVLVKLTAERVQKARLAATAAIRHLRPEQLVRGLDAAAWKRRTERAQIKLPEEYSLVDLTGLRSVLPDVSVLLNQSLCRIGYGVAFARSSGHPVGNLALVEHYWRPEEQERFKQGELPFEWFSPGTSDKTCLVLRVQDHSWPRGEQLLHGSVGIRRAHWKKPVQGDKRHIILGTLLDHRTAPPNDRLSWMLILPSGLTTMFDSTDDRLKKLPADAATRGEHLSRHANTFDTQLTSPPWPSAHSVMRFTSQGHSFLAKEPSINILRYILNLTDDTVAYQLKDILESQDTASIKNPQSARPDPNAVFEATPYHWTGREFDECAYEYGCKSRRPPFPSSLPSPVPTTLQNAYHLEQMKGKSEREMQL